jgi:hypothetical protein
MTFSKIKPISFSTKMEMIQNHKLHFSPEVHIFGAFPDRDQNLKGRSFSLLHKAKERSRLVFFVRQPERGKNTSALFRGNVLPL